MGVGAIEIEPSSRRRRRVGSVVLLLVLTSSEASAHFGDGRRDDEDAARRRDPGGATRSPPGRGDPGPEDRGALEPGSDEPGPLPLFPRIPLARAAGWILPPEPTPDTREEQAEAALDRYLDEAVMSDRIVQGDVDGWYHGAGRAMRQRFRPDQGEVERDRRRGMSLLQRAIDELGRYASGPLPPQGGPAQMLPEQRAMTSLPGQYPGDRRAAAEQEWWERCNALNSPVTWYRVDLRVTHNPEGQLSAAWVLRSSGIEALDEAALEAARSAAVDLTPPPEHVVGHRQAIRSDWAFEMGDVATPISCMVEGGAVAQVQCVDDPVLGTMCAVLGRGIIRTRVRLLAVVDATHLTPEERRAARRRDPDRTRP